MLINERKARCQNCRKKENRKTRTHWRRNWITQRSLQSLRYWSHWQDRPSLIEIRHAITWLRIQKPHHLQHDRRSWSLRPWNRLRVILGRHHIQTRWQRIKSKTFFYFRMVSTKFSICSTTIEPDTSTSTTLRELPSNSVRQWIWANLKKCSKELLPTERRFQRKISTTSWPKRPSDFIWSLMHFLSIFFLYFSV